MIDHDRLFKELITTFFAEFVDLFLLGEGAAHNERLPSGQLLCHNSNRCSGWWLVDSLRRKIAYAIITR